MPPTIRLVAFAILGLSASASAKPVAGDFGNYASSVDSGCAPSCSAILCGTSVPVPITTYITVTHTHTFTRNLSSETPLISVSTVTETPGPITITVTAGTGNPAPPASTVTEVAPTLEATSSNGVTVSIPSAAESSSAIGSVPSPIIDTIVPTPASVNTITLIVTDSGIVKTQTHTVTRSPTNTMPLPAASTEVLPQSESPSAAASSPPIFTTTRIITESGIVYTVTHTQTRSPTNSDIPPTVATVTNTVVPTAAPVIQPSSSIYTVTVTFGEGVVNTYTRTMTDAPPAFMTPFPTNNTDGFSSCAAPSIIFQTTTETVTFIETATLDAVTKFNPNTLTRTHTVTNSPNTGESLATLPAASNSSTETATPDAVTEFNSNTLTHTHTVTNSPNTGESLVTLPTAASDSSTEIPRFTTRILVADAKPIASAPITAAEASSTPCDDENMWTEEASSWTADPTQTWDGQDGNGNWDAEPTGTKAWDGNDGSWDAQPTDGNWDDKNTWTQGWNGEETGASSYWGAKPTGTKGWAAYGW